MADFLATYDSAPIPGAWSVAADPATPVAVDMYVGLVCGLPAGTFDAPVDAPPAITGWLEREGFFYDFYFRIWITPSGELDIGGLSSDQSIPIMVWNAYPDAANTLQALDAQGMDENTLTAPANPPLVFNALEMKTYTLLVAANGQPLVDVLLTWTFTGIAPEYLHVTGFRAKPWSIPPDWRNPPVDRYEWLTDVMQSRSAFEQRQQLRQAPRRTITASFVVMGDDLGWFDALLFSWGAKGFLLPIWYDRSVLTADLPSGSDLVYCDTSNREFTAGGFIMIGKDVRTAIAMQVLAVNADSVQLVRSVAANHAAGESAWPAHMCRVTSPAQQTQDTAGVVEMQIAFEIVDQDEIAPAPSTTTFSGYQVLTRNHNWIYTIARSYERKLSILDSTTNLPVWIDQSNWAQITRQLKIMLKDRANRQDFIGWLSSVSGRLTPFWREDRETMLQMTANQPIGDTALLYIKPIGFPSLLYGQPGRMAIVLRHQNGTIYYRNILAAQVDMTTGDEILTLDTNIPASRSSDWRLITYLEFVRLDADAIEIAHQTSEMSEVQFSIRGVKQ